MCGKQAIENNKDGTDR